MKKLGGVGIISVVFLLLASSGWGKNFFPVQKKVVQEPIENYGMFADGIFTEDIDHDAYPDLISLHSVQNGQDTTFVVLVLLGAGENASAKFIPTQTNAFSNYIEPGHFYDGQTLDLLTLDRKNVSNDSFKILKGKGDGTFEPQQSVYPNGQIADIEPFDADGDGVHERLLLVTHSNKQEIQFYKIDNQGNFIFEISFNVPVSAEQILTQQLVGNASYPDLMIRGSGLPNRILTYEGNGDGTFSYLQTADIESPFTDSGYPWVTLTDLNGDSIFDMLLTDWSEGIYSYLRNGNSFEKVGGSFTPPYPGHVLDVNNDGFSDLVGFDGWNALKLLEGDGKGGFLETRIEVDFETPAAKLYSGDFNLDGYDDLGVMRAGIFIYYANTPPTLSAQSWDASTRKIRVTYTDKDNERPFVTTDAKIEVLVDGQAIAMNEVDAADTDATAAGGGKIYEAKVDAAAGVHKVAFFATDGTYNATGDLTLEHDFDLTPAPSNGGGGGCTLSPSNDAQSSASNSKSSGALFFIVMGSGLAFFGLVLFAIKARKKTPLSPDSNSAVASAHRSASKTEITNQKKTIDDLDKTGVFVVPKQD